MNLSSKTPPIRISIEAPDTPPPPEDNFKINGAVAPQPGLLGVKFGDPDKDSIMSSTTSLNIAQKPKPKIPDGGWGWVVVASSLVLSMIADGIAFSFGLLYIEFLNYFGASKSTTSWIGSLFVAVPLLTGPIMSALVDRYGCRPMTIIGGVVGALGFVLSFPVNSIGIMYITFGLVSGLGLGLCYVTAVVSIAYWFDKKRTLAVGLGACGTGIGTFVYAPMTTYFISEFGWRGTLLLLAGTLLNLCVCGAVMREPDWLIEEEENKSLAASKKSGRNASSISISGRSVSEFDFPGVKEIRKLMKSGENPEYILHNLVTSMDPTTSPEEPKTKEHHQSLVNLPTFVKQSEKVPIEVLQQLSSNKKLYNVILENYPNILSCRSTSDQALNTLAEDTSTNSSRAPVRMSLKLRKAKKQGLPAKQLGHQESLRKDRDVEIPLMTMKSSNTRQDSKKKTTHLKRADSLTLLRGPPPLTKHHLKNLKLRKHSVVYRGAMLNLPKYRLRASSCPDIYRNSMITLPRELEVTWHSELKEFFVNMVDFTLFLDLHFSLMALATTMLFTWFVIPYFYLAEHLTKHGYTESDASMIISVIGITNTIGMIGLGWAGDQPWLHVTKTYAVCLILCGATCACFMIFTNNFIMLLITGGLFGIFFSSTFSFTPAILVDLISLDNFTQAYGLILLCQGMGHLLGPPLGGALYDLTGSWEQSFWQAGIWISISGVIIGIIPFTNNRRFWKQCGNADTQSDRTSVA